MRCNQHNAKYLSLLQLRDIPQFVSLCAEILHLLLFCSKKIFNFASEKKKVFENGKATGTICLFHYNSLLCVHVYSNFFSNNAFLMFV